MQTRNNNIINEISYFCTLSNSFVFCGIYVETLGLSTVFLEEFCTESLTVSMS